GRGSHRTSGCQSKLIFKFLQVRTAFFGLTIGAFPNPAAVYRFATSCWQEKNPSAVAIALLRVVESCRSFRFTIVVFNPPSASVRSAFRATSRAEAVSTKAVCEHPHRPGNANEDSGLGRFAQ